MSLRAKQGWLRRAALAGAIIATAAFTLGATPRPASAQYYPAAYPNYAYPYYPYYPYYYPNYASYPSYYGNPYWGWPVGVAVGGWGGGGWCGGGWGWGCGWGLCQAWGDCGGGV